jgi:hypothetical protein
MFKFATLHELQSLYSLWDVIALNILVEEIKSAQKEQE